MNGLGLNEVEKESVMHWADETRVCVQMMNGYVMHVRLMTAQSLHKQLLLYYTNRQYGAYSHLKRTITFYFRCSFFYFNFHNYVTSNKAKLCHSWKNNMTQTQQYARGVYF